MKKRGRREESARACCRFEDTERRRRHADDRSCYEAFRDQIESTPGSGYLFPAPRTGSSQPYIGSLKKIWASTLGRANVLYFSLYELRHTFTTRLSAGGVADEWVTQLLRQGDAKVFKRYSKMKLQMMRESLNRLHRRANEQP